MKATRSWGGKETGTCYDVDVRFEDGLYKMNFTWQPHRSIAQTESPDGIHWSPFETLLSPRLDSGWEDTASICIAHSPDGVTRWTRFPGNPIVEPAALSLPKEERLALRPGGTGRPGSSWDAAACYKPSIVKDLKNKRWLLWYNGRNCRDEYIGLAIHDGLDLDL